MRRRAADRAAAASASEFVAGALAAFATAVRNPASQAGGEGQRLEAVRGADHSGRASVGVEPWQRQRRCRHHV